jgi:hypothetical protein
MVPKGHNRAAGFVGTRRFGRRSLQKGGNNEMVHCTPNNNIVIFYSFVKLKILSSFYKNLKKLLDRKITNCYYLFLEGTEFSVSRLNLFGGFYESSHNKRQI